MANCWVKENRIDLIPSAIIPSDKRGKIKAQTIENFYFSTNSCILVDFEVTVTTGNKLGAGTDAKVYLILYGDKGQSDKLHLVETKTNTDPFEKGKTDVFIVSSLNIGDIAKINISHDGEGSGAGWFLEKMKIKNLNTEKIVEYVEI